MAEGARGRGGTWAVLAICAVAGAGTMTIELAAVRMLAPWWGTSLVVWTNVIGVILLALATGYLLGGRLCAGGRPLSRLGFLLLFAAAATAWLPALAAPVSELFLPEALALDEAAALVLWGSLAAALLLFLPPAALLGSIAPLGVEAVQLAEEGHAGAAGGRVLAASTLGSLAGVFGTSHLLVPGFGITATFLVAGAALALAGSAALALGRGRPGTLALVAAAGTAAAFPVSRVSPPAPPDGWHLLAAQESAYQSIRIVEDRREGGSGLRLLQVNEGFDSFQSVWQAEPGLLPEGYYYSYFALPLLWTAGPGPFRVEVLGLGGGTTWRVLEGVAPPERELELHGVELDPDVVRLGREHMGLSTDGERGVRGLASGVDARLALRAPAQPRDLIVLDCFANQIEIPPHLSTLEFFRAARGMLAAGGWLAANLGGFGFDDPVVAAVAATCAQAFGRPVLLVRVPMSRNFVLFARRDGDLPIEGGRLAAVPGEVARRLLAPLEVPGAWKVVEPGGEPILTDDRNPIDRLQVLSIREGRARRGGDGG